MNDVHFGLLVSYLSEQKMSTVDRGEELADSDYLPYKNTRGKIKFVPSAKVLDMDVDKGITLLVSPTLFQKL